MTCTIGFGIALCLATVLSVRAQECDRTIQGPISLPVRNVTLAGGHVRRGLDVQLGTPPQPLALAVSGYYNNSYIYDGSPQCGSTATTECISIRGGAFDEAASSSLSSSVIFSDFSTLDEQAGIGSNTVLTGMDTFTINDSLTVEQYPFGTPRTDQMQFLDSSQLGMGKDSSLLTMLRNQGSIASRSFSLFWGETGMSSDHQLDGNLVIGGLDEAKISGPNYTTKMQHGSPCPSGMLLSITDMSLQFPSGASRSIMAAEVGQSVNYCLAPEYPIITMPQSMFTEWIVAHPGSATDGNADSRAGGFPNVWGLVYSPDVIFDGDLKITIDSNFEITIPNHQLVQYYYTFDDNGDAQVNSTVQELMINPLVSTNLNDLPKFGMTFLQAAYMHVNYDEDTLTLWQAEPSEEQSLVGVGKSTRGCATNSSSSAPSTASTTSAPATPGKSDSGLSSGAIAGIVIGMLAVLALIGGGLWYLRYRRRPAPDTEVTTKTMETAYRADPQRFSAPMYRKWELDATSSNTESWNSQAKELPTVSVYNKPIPELPAERYD